PEWYLTTYPDVASVRIDPVRHYIAYGARERRNPSPTFCTERYLEDHPEVAQSGENPLAHWLRTHANRF
ncbi:SAM-dependent methyltransferase, partial [Rhodoplanes sp. SY1]